MVTRPLELSNESGSRRSPCLKPCRTTEACSIVQVPVCDMPRPLFPFRRERIPAGGVVLDMMSSWVSHLPPDVGAFACRVLQRDSLSPCEARGREGKGGRGANKQPFRFPFLFKGSRQSIALGFPRVLFFLLPRRASFFPPFFFFLLLILSFFSFLFLFLFLLSFFVGLLVCLPFCLKVQTLTSNSSLMP